MRFEKWHALGNAYLIVERPDAGRLDPPRVSRLCSVDRGIGADGVLEVTTKTASRAEVRVWNPDGSTSEMSGNGTRIAAAWLLRDTGSESVEIVTGGRSVHCSPLGEGLVRQALGEVDVRDDELLDVAGERLRVTPVDLGNPHAVVLRDDLSRDDLLRLGPALETHGRFPQRTNVQLVRPDGERGIGMLVWERGAGETSASGSSATAVAAVAVSRGWCESPVRVTMPGGELLVAMEGRRATLDGPAEPICAGTTEL